MLIKGGLYVKSERGNPIAECLHEFIRTSFEKWPPDFDRQRHDPKLCSHGRLEFNRCPSVENQNEAEENIREATKALQLALSEQQIRPQTSLPDKSTTLNMKAETASTRANQQQTKITDERNGRTDQRRPVNIATQENRNLTVIEQTGQYDFTTNTKNKATNLRPTNRMNDARHI